jgi:hypothetical protein
MDFSSRIGVQKIGSHMLHMNPKVMRQRYLPFFRGKLTHIGSKKCITRAKFDV